MDDNRRQYTTRNDAATPPRVTVLAELALPLTVAEAVEWDDAQPGRLAVAIAEAALAGRALPLAVVDLAKARPDLFPTAKAAEHALVRGNYPQTPIRNLYLLYREMGVVSSLSPAHYRRHGARGPMALALVPKEAPRAALEAIVGPLAAYQDSAPQSDTEQAGLPPVAMLPPVMLTPPPSDSWWLPTGDRIETAPSVTTAPVRTALPAHHTTRLTIGNATDDDEVLLADLSWHGPVTARVAPAASFAEMQERLTVAAREPVPPGFLGLTAPRFPAAAV